MPQLNRLDFNSKTLLVCLEELRHTKHSIEGKFVVNSIHNTVKDIQDCLNSPFNQKPILELDGREVTITITGVNWGFDYNAENTFSNLLSYQCTFTAFGAREIPSDKENRVIWDAGRFEISIMDIQELVGGEDIDALADRALELIEKYANYEPTVNHPCPSSFEGTGIEEDVAAVLALKKPAAVFDETELVNPLLVLLIKEVQARGLRVETVESFGGNHSVVVGLPYNVRQITEIIRQGVENDSVNEYFYWRVGKLLGHPDDALAKFIENVKDFGFNRA